MKMETRTLNQDNLFASGSGFATKERVRAGGTYILTEDVWRVLASGIVESECLLQIRNAVNIFNKRVAESLTLAYPKDTIARVSEEPFYRTLNSLVELENRRSLQSGTIIVNIDRYIDGGRDSSRVFPLAVGRIITEDGKEILATRPGTGSLESQIQRINDNVSPNRTIVFVDDGFSSLRALMPYLAIAKENDWNIESFIVGVCPTERGEWAKTEVLAQEITGKPVRKVVSAVDPVEWTNMRDFLLFGGLMIKGNSYSLLAPYFYPFSEGEKASIPKEYLLAISKEVLQANADLVTAIDRSRDTPLTFSDSLKAGYGLPTSTIGAIETPQPDEPIGGFIRKALRTI